MADYSSLHRQLRHYWSMDNGSPPYTQWDKTRVFPLNYYDSIPSTGLLEDGKIGKAIKVVADGCGRPYGPTFIPDPDYVTIASWIYMKSLATTQYAINASYSVAFGAHYLFYDHTTGKFTFRIRDNASGVIVTVQSPTTAATGWHLLIGKWDIVNQMIGIRVDNSIATWTFNPNIAVYSPGKIFRVGYRVNDLVDDTAYWTRQLTDQEEGWLWNGGSGLGYDDWGVQLDDTSCAEIPCCEEDPYSYQVSTATASGSSTGSDCVEVPFVTIEPPSGSFVTFPTFIILSSSMSGSVIRYTTDGTDPTEDSTVYTIPFEILGESTTVKAKAWFGDCDGPIAVATYRRPDWDFTFYNVCPPIAPLRAGIWGDFVGPASGTNYKWMLTFTPASPVHIERFEIYETNSAGVWNTGQAWSTDEYIDPPNGTTNFHVYPLVLDEGGQLNATYSTDFCTDFGDFAAAAHSVSMYGNVQIDVPGVTYFRLRMFLQDGSILERIIASNECDPPPCELYPPTPTLAVACGQITVSWTDIVGATYQLWKYSGDTGTVVQIDTGTNTAGPDSYVDTAVVAGVLYCYHLRTKYLVPPVYNCPVFTAGDAACAQGQAYALLSATQDITLIEGAAGTVTVDVVSQNLAAGGACADNAVHYDYTDGSGHHTDVIDGVTVNGNTPQTLLMTLVRPAAAPYEVVITFTGCNICNTATASITVEFTPPPECVGTSPPLPAIVSVTSASLQALVTATQATALTTTNPNDPCYAQHVATNSPAWGGQLVWAGAGCNYVSGSGTQLCFWFYNDWGNVALGYVYAFIGFVGGTQWVISIQLENGEYVTTIWAGSKDNGDTPVGTYTQLTTGDPALDGCVTLATLEVA